MAVSGDTVVDEGLNALSWVHDELRRSLEATHKALRRYLKAAADATDLDPVDPAVLRQARAQLHQALGAVELVGLGPAAMLLRASEGALQRLSLRPKLITSSAVDAIERGSFALLDFVGRRLANKVVTPLALFPQYRVLQELAGASRIHPADLWSVSWTWRSLPPDRSAAPRQPDATTVAAVEADLLAQMRGAPPSVSARMSEVFAGLAAGLMRHLPDAGNTITDAQHVGERQLATLWQLAAAFYEAQADGLLKPDVYSKRIGSRLLAQLRAGPHAEPSQRLAHDLLFFCSQATPRAGLPVLGLGSSGRLTAVRQGYALADEPVVDFETPRLGRFDPARVSQARKRVAAAKEVWAAIAGGDLSRLSGLVEQMALVGDSLQRLYPDGGVLGQALQAAAQGTVTAQAEPPAELAMEVATALLYVDASLDDADFDQSELGQRVHRLAQRIDQVRQHRDPGVLELWMEDLYRRVSDRQTMGNVVQELRASLSEVEKHIDRYFRNPTLRDVLIPVPAQLQAMRGVLSVLGLDQASQAVLRMSDDVDALSDTEADPHQVLQSGSFERLADNLGALSFLIDMVAVQPQMAKSLFRFNPVTGSLAAVMARQDRPSGFGDVDDQRTQTTPPDTDAVAVSLEFDRMVKQSKVQQRGAAGQGSGVSGLPLLSGFDALGDSSQAPLDSAGRAPAAQAPASAQPVPARSSGWPVSASGDAGTANASDASDHFDRSEAGDTELLTWPDETATAAAPVQPEHQNQPEPEADPEMLAVFIDEVQDVAGQARASLARLQDAPGDRTAVTTVRRAFHTLKGSARMVGLTAFGEAAWACEQLYNSRLAEQAPLVDATLLAFSTRAIDHFERWSGAVAVGQADGFAAAEVLAWAADVPHTAEQAGAELAPLPDVMAPDQDWSEVATGFLADADPAAASDQLQTRVPGLPSADDLDLPVLGWPGAQAPAPAPASAPTTAPTSADRPEPQAQDTAFAPAPQDLSVWPDAPAQPETTELFASDDLDPADAGQVSELGQPTNWVAHEAAPAEAHAGAAAADDLPATDPVEAKGTADATWAPVGADTFSGAPEPGAPQAFDLPPLDLPDLDLADLDQDAGSATGPLAEAYAADMPDHPAWPEAPDASALGDDGVEAEAKVEWPASAVPDLLLDSGDAGTLPPPGMAHVDLGQAMAQDDLDLPLPTVDDGARHQSELGANANANADADADADIDLPLEMGAAADAPSVWPQDAGPVEGEESFKEIGHLRISQSLFNIFLNEADDLSRRLGEALAEWRQEPQRAPGEATVALAHSLAGGSGTVGYDALAALARGLEHALDRSQNRGHALAGEPALCAEVSDEIRRLLHLFAAGFLNEPGAGLLARLDALAHAPAPSWSASQPAPLAGDSGMAPLFELSEFGNSAMTPFSAHSDLPRSQPGAGGSGVAFDDEIDQQDAIDAELFPVFEEEALELLPRLHASLRDWSQRPADTSLASACMRSLHTFKGGARLAGAMRLGERAHRLETAIERLNTRQVMTNAADIEALVAYADALDLEFDQLRGVSPAADAEPVALASARGGAAPEGLSPAAEPAPGPATDVAPDVSAFDAAPPEPAVAAALPAAEPGADAEPGAGADPIPDAAALVDDGIAAAAGADPQQPPQAWGAEDLARAAAAPAADWPDQPSGLLPQVDPTTAPAEAPAPEPAPVAAASPQVDWQRFMQGTTLPAEEPAVVRPATGSVRVRAALLDRLVGHAGEVSIARARIETDVQQFKAGLGELSDNLERLRTQLRDLELQGETQIGSRLEAARQAQQQFDPLEMDRFTRFQELTRMMAESVGDVATVQRGLTRTLQATEDTLAQQHRVSRDMQDDLLRTRLVEFEGLSERLYRVVRQAAKETGKPVRLDIEGGSIEVDRGVLDRMTPAFEHLLRNSVVHGIESPEQRAAAGKDATGTITLTVGQLGNEVAVEVRDDGGGLHLDRIRERALALGLVQTDGWGNCSADEAELINLIYHPGFTTAAEVTDLAGRGVGMDVVRTEVNAIGGRIETATAAGQGASFRLVLPLTTAVTQVVMLRCGERSVAVPSTLVESVTRVPPAELEASYARGTARVGERELPFFWLDALLQGTARGTPSGRSAPMVVIRSASRRVVLHVDEVVSNQEVVVKHLGPQLTRLPGLVGITLLPSGLPALIYNPVPLATAHGTVAHARVQAVLQGTRLLEGDGAAEPAEALAPLVMVVDDSLTVRRVTQRLLEREGLRVVLAKDGLDAMDKLAGEMPVVVLSDIEMPRMDGFDLLRSMRAVPRLARLPVVMITSRLAQKHRDYAAELGADHYLGKPYAEDALLALVKGYVAQAGRH